ncbi:hypothetical protein HK27_07480 [Acetobacter orientalis]|nr:hypothetical protein HK27_07480 [Acetobacter orientalis]
MVYNKIQGSNFLENNIKDAKEFIKNIKFWLFIAALMLLTNGMFPSEDFSIIKQNSVYLVSVSVFIYVIFLAFSVEDNSIFKAIWEYNIIKILLSSLFSVLVIFCAGDASGKINNVFPVDASSLPITKTITTIICVDIKLYYIILTFLGLLFVTYTVKFIHVLKNSDEYSDPLISGSSNFSMAFVAIVLFFSQYSMMNKKLSGESLNKFIYNIAHNMEFNKNYKCKGINFHSSVIFLGSNYNAVLVDDNVSVSPENWDSQFDKIKIYVTRCNID